MPATGDFMKEALELACDLARQAGQLQRLHAGKAKHIEHKGTVDIVTEVDRASEKLIVDGIIKRFPNHSILAEEGSGPKHTSDYRWIIDPIDGTTNFAHGLPLFCVSIALEVKGEMIVGVIYNPSQDELYAAAKGEGATLNGKKMHVSSRDALINTLVGTGFIYSYDQGETLDNIDHFRDFTLRTRAVRRLGSAALSLADLAAGRFDGYWELILQPWDMAAGVLLIREAGGVVTTCDGNPFDVYGHSLLASNGKIHQDMLDVLQHKK